MNPRKLVLPAAVLCGLLAACDELAPPPQKTNRSAPAPVAQLPSTPATPASPLAQPSEDAELSRKVKQTLDAGQGSNAISSSGHVEVAATGGVVTLYGTVDAVSEKKRAALIAMGVEGVRSVVNNLVVVRGS